jgi:hypothetical protein
VGSCIQWVGARLWLATHSGSFAARLKSDVANTAKHSWLQHALLFIPTSSQLEFEAQPTALLQLQQVATSATAADIHAAVSVAARRT